MRSDIGYICLEDARVQAFQHPLIDFPNAFRGGPVLETPELQSFRHHRGWSTFDHFAPDAAYPDRLDGDYVYAGPLFDHFGHFISEMAHRIIPAHTRALGHKFLFVTTEVGGASTDLLDIAPFVRDILSFLRINSENAVVVNRNTVVERLHLFDQGARLAGPAKLAYLDEVREFSTARLDELCGDAPRPRKLYVSRSALPKLGSLLGERYVEGELAREGFAVYRPELDPFVVQMDHYRKADIVVFAEGSAVHGTELLGSRMMGETFLIPRSPQAHIFDRVLEPRSRRYARLDVSRYVGTAIYEPGSGSPSFHRGASLLRPRALPQTFRKEGIANMPTFSLAAHAKAVARDLVGYFREVRRSRAPLSRRYALQMLKSVALGDRPKTPSA